MTTTKPEPRRLERPCNQCGKVAVGIITCSPDYFLAGQHFCSRECASACLAAKRKFGRSGTN